MSASKEKLSNAPGHAASRPVLLELASLCVFNSELGPKEGEEDKKILFFYPPLTNIDVQIRHVGLMEAVSKFVQSFTDNDVRSVLTSQFLHIMYQPERDFWIAMSLLVSKSSDSSHAEDADRTREEQPQDDVYQIILQRSYKMYKMLYGLMSQQLSKTGAKALKKTLTRFYSDYFSKVSFGQHDVLHQFEAMTYLPMDRKSFLEVQSFVNTLLITFKEARHVMLLYWDFLVWNDLDLEEALTVNQFIARFLLPDQLERDMLAIHLNAPSTNQFSSQGHLGRFHFGPENIWAPDAVCYPAPAYLSGDGSSTSVQRFNFVVYSASGCSICLFLDEVLPNPIEYYRKLDIFLGPVLTALAGTLAEQCSKVKNPVFSHDTPGLHYIYINDANLSKKQTVMDRTQSVQSELLKALSGIDGDLRSRPDDAEIFAKVLHDCWIYGRRTFDRRLFAVITQRNADLEIAEEEIRKLCIREFPTNYDTYTAV